MRTKRLHRVLFSTMLVSSVVAAPVSAATRHVTINPLSVDTFGGADVRDFRGIVLPELADWGWIPPPPGSDAPDIPGFYFGFVIPPDYRTNSLIRIRLTYYTSDTNCTIAFGPVELTRFRAANLVADSLPQGELTAGNGRDELIARARPSIARRKTFYLRAGQGLDGQRSGDAIILGFARDPASPVDSCIEDLSIVGIDIRYISRGR